jgi:hypothetical protein
MRARASREFESPRNRAYARLRARSASLTRYVSFRCFLELWFGNALSVGWVTTGNATEEVTQIRLQLDFELP